MAPPPSRASGPYRPTRLGQWEVIAKIAGGGMSAVYLGRRFDPDPDLPSVVALKIVRHDVAKDDRLVQMFLDEGRLLARLVHPNIVRTLEVGCEAEQDFIAMELMLGKTLGAIHDALAQRGVRLAPEIVAWVTARIADALHYAHELTDEHGRPLALVHRDVNPANVFATFAGEVKLFDFGLAKETAGEASGSQMLAGKLSYLSPEQIMQMPLDRRSDIFSLGTTLWELLTSRRLFRRDSDIDTVRAVQLGPIPDPRSVAPEVPEELARIARTALERNRDHRYPSAAYLARELDAFVSTRCAPGDITARITQLVDTLFPGEHKRQSGWLKPAITSSISRAPGSVSTTPRPGTVSRPMPPEVRRDTRETTIVMTNAPAIPSSSREPLSATTVPDGVPAISAPSSTPREAMPSAFPSSATARDGVPSVPPSLAPTARYGAPAAPPSLAPTARYGAASVEPPSLATTARDGVPSVRPPSPPAAPAITARDGVPSAPPPRASWPAPSQGPSHAAPAPPRSHPPPAPFSRTEIQAIPPAPDSRTEIQRMASTIEAPAAKPTPAKSASAPPNRESTPSTAPGGPVGGRPLPKRPPIPLPSRARADSGLASQPPAAMPPARTEGARKAVVEKAPDSDRTQIDMPIPAGPGPGAKRP
ncbi:MAG: hypothetical protein BGO98_20895 [Myxococcales bacterium 68-20]|nr:protein kinase [Myxococcales bacterium]OJY28023.1 MAG: hypothetical protein BGO98_20895 [Myxococcales bacterium 68-20]